MAPADSPPSEVWIQFSRVGFGKSVTSPQTSGGLDVFGVEDWFGWGSHRLEAIFTEINLRFMCPICSEAPGNPREHCMGSLNVTLSDVKTNGC